MSGGVEPPEFMHNVFNCVRRNVQQEDFRRESTCPLGETDERTSLQELSLSWTMA
ncbi:hypothetical protein HY2_11415 [Hyphomonas pacifica]|nr:hypothetical protein HY2_11415 [Hyphomonas pacifica]